MVSIIAGASDLFISFLGIVVGNASGAGAGGFVVPCLFICFGYNLAQSVALWNGVSLGVSVWRFINSVVTQEKHPEGNRPIIDFNSVLMFQPMLFIGIECGFITMAILPEGVKLIGFSLMLLALTLFTLRKANARKQMEFAKKPIETSLVPQNNDTELQSVVSPIKNTQPEKILERYSGEEPYVPIKKLLLNAVAFILLGATHLLLGSSKAPSLIGIQSCSSTYWLILVIYFSSLIVLLYFSYKIVQSEHQERIEKGIAPLPSEFEWTPNLIINTSLLAILSGFFSSSYGVGGGIILNMVMIYKGVNPEVVTATTMLSIACICISTTTVYYINHILPLDGYAISLMILGVPVTIISYMFLKKILQKHSSLILFTLAYALGASAILVLIFGFYKAYYIDHNTLLWTFGTICHKS